MGLRYENRFASPHLGRSLLRMGFQEFQPPTRWRLLWFFVLLWLGKIVNFLKGVLQTVKRKLFLPLFILLIASAYPAAGQVYRQSATLLSAATVAVKSPWLDLEAIVPFRHTVTIRVTGSPTGCTLSLEGAITETRPSENDAFDMSGGQTCTSNITFHVANKPVRWARANLSALSGGTSPTVTVLYEGTR